MPGTNYVSAINVHICRSVVPGHAGGHVPGRSAAYENQALKSAANLATEEQVSQVVESRNDSSPKTKHPSQT